MTKKPVAVVDNESGTKPGERIRVLRRFETIKEAEEWVGDRPDKAKLERGGYGIDAPEELVNPPPRRADIEITGGLGLYTITPTSDAGREWFEENVHIEARQRLGQGVGCDDGRLVAAIVDGAQAAGLEVE